MSETEVFSIGSDATIEELELHIGVLTERLNAMRRAADGYEVSDYTFQTQYGETRLSDLFAGRDRLFVIHNMGQGCRSCTLWADGFNGFVPHLESAMAVVLVSKDDPETQRLFANSRGWRFRLASHAGGDYMREQIATPDYDNMPGAVLYERKDGKIVRKNSVFFGPGDIFCSIWHILALAGYSEDDWTPQFNYWLRPQELDDGGENVLG